MGPIDGHVVEDTIGYRTASTRLPCWRHLPEQPRFRTKLAFPKSNATGGQHCVHPWVQSKILLLIATGYSMYGRAMFILDGRKI